MKNNLIRTMFLATLFVFGMMSVCFADVYMPPPIIVDITIPLISVILNILGVILIISLICIFVGKKNNSENFVNTAKKWAERALYFILILIATSIILMILGDVSFITVVLLSPVILSLIFRMINKKVSYGILIVMGVLVFPPLLLIVLLIKLMSENTKKNNNENENGKEGQNEK